jgi:hypothetical protein
MRSTGWGEKVAQRSLALSSCAGATSLVNATHLEDDSEIRFGRGGKQIGVLKVRRSECLRLKEARRVKD